MAISGTTSGPELLVELDRAAPEPLHRQLANGLRDAIRTGRLAPATRLPSTRVLAADLGVSRRLVVDAYSQLAAEGFLLSRHGSGTRVATVDAASAPQRDAGDAAKQFDIDFAPGSPDLGSFPRHAWLRALRQGLTEIESHAFGYVAPQGLPSARVAVADYLRRTRGVLADPQHIVLCSGATQAIALLASVLSGQTLAMEDPGFWLHRMVLRHNGIEPLPVPVDDDGLTSPPSRTAARQTVLATPAHQSPTGVVLSAARRTALVQWARADHLVIEDDYDAEYRYDRAPVGALQGIAPDRVVYVGSTSKTLAPGLRIGWMVLPAHLVGADHAVERPGRHRKFGDGPDRVREAADLRRIRPAPAPDAPSLPDPPKRVAAGAGPVPAGGDRAGRGRGRSPDGSFPRRLPDRGAG